MPSNGTGRRAVYVATISAVLAMTAGFAMASLLTTTTVTESSSVVGTAANGVTNFALTANSVTLAPGVNSLGSCAAGPETMTGGSAGAGSSDVAVLGTTGNCALNDFVEVFTFTSVPTLTTGVNDTFLVFTTWTPTSGPAASTALNFTLNVVAGAGQGSDGGGTLTLLIDFGTSGPPGSISNLQVVISEW